MVPSIIKTSCLQNETSCSSSSQIKPASKEILQTVVKQYCYIWYTCDSDSIPINYDHFDS